MIWTAEEVWFWRRFVPRPRLRLERFSAQLSLSGIWHLRLLLFTLILFFFCTTIGIYHLLISALYRGSHEECCDCSCCIIDTSTEMRWCKLHEPDVLGVKVSALFLLSKISIILQLVKVFK